MNRLLESKPSIATWLVLGLALLVVLPIVATVPVALVTGSGLAVTVTAALSAFLALILIAAFLRLMVAEPLVRAAGIARRVAEGNLDVKLPRSRVSEINDVQAALNFMSEELQKSLERRESMEVERRLLVSGVAHDLRTPLFALNGYLEGLEVGIAESPERRLRYIQGARERAQRLERLISQLFDFARLEYPESEPDLKTLGLSEPLMSLLEGFRSSMDSKGVELVAVKPEAPCLIQGDEDLLMRAIGNLLDNALRYTPSPGTVTVAWGSDEGNAWITVADSGPGISPVDLPHIFQPAYRGDASRQTSEVGAGLGLTIASRIIESHGGHLTAENKPAGGAMFRARMPAHVRA